MTTRRTWTTAGLIGLLAVCGALAAQTVGSALEDAKKPVSSEELQQQANDQVIKQIQQDSESVIAGTHFTYDPNGRRDPFEPLIKSEPLQLGKRPKGIAGMTVAEIALKGCAIDPRGNPVALFRGSDNRGYTLRVGDTIYDGRVLSIEPRNGIVVFRQQVDDPRRIKPYRDVMKRLNPIREQEDQEGDGESSDSVEGA